MKKLSFLTPPTTSWLRVYMVDGERSSIATNNIIAAGLEPSIPLPTSH
jgi:hypothetical protein